MSSGIKIVGFVAVGILVAVAGAMAFKPVILPILGDWSIIIAWIIGVFAGSSIFYSLYRTFPNKDKR